jgi:hypothetical protein
LLFSFFAQDAHYLRTNRLAFFLSGHARALRKIRVDGILPFGYVSDMFLKRLGPDPHANGAQTHACRGCPDIWELEGGDFAIIGTDITDAAHRLPSTASCGPDERIIRVPRKTLVLAKSDIPERL